MRRVFYGTPCYRLPAARAGRSHHHRPATLMAARPAGTEPRGKPVMPSEPYGRRGGYPLFCICHGRDKAHNEKGWYYYQPLLSLGAEGESRTPTPLPELDPEPSVSTNSTTSAQQKCVYAIPARLASIFSPLFLFCGNMIFLFFIFKLIERCLTDAPHRDNRHFCSGTAETAGGSPCKKALGITGSNGASVFPCNGMCISIRGS